MVAFFMISVHENYNGLEISSQLLQESEAFLRRRHPDIKLISCETSATESADMFQHLGFQKIKEVMYGSYPYEPVSPVPNSQCNCIVWAKPV